MLFTCCQDELLSKLYYEMQTARYRYCVAFAATYIKIRREDKHGVCLLKHHIYLERH